MQTASLVNLALGAGCGCKIDAAELSSLLTELSGRTAHRDLLVGVETADDCAVWRFSDERYLLFTTDFFTPPVDDPYDYGRMAAANALSDVFAMGGRPFAATTIFGYPPDIVDAETARTILRAGLDAMAEVGCTVAGGHTIKNQQPIFGFSVIGEVAPSHLKTNSGARAGDLLVLTKPLGIGIFSNALQQGILEPEQYTAIRPLLTSINRIGAELGPIAEVTALTDVTGFGLLGHALEMAEGAGLTLNLDAKAIPIMDGAKELASVVFSPGSGGARNLSNTGETVDFDADVDRDTRLILSDPQSNGGLLVAVTPSGIDRVLKVLKTEPLAQPAVIGQFNSADQRACRIHVR
jgi:selenide, water dikinase